MSIQFKVKIVEKVFEVEADNENETIESLKERVAPIVNIPAGEQKWIFQGRIITSSMTMAEGNIKAGSCVIIMKVTAASGKVSAVSTPAITVSAATQRGGTANSPALPTNSAMPMVPTFNHPTGGVLFDRAMLLLLGNDENVVTNAVSTLLKIINNIIQNPSEEKYRKVSNNNATFLKKIGNVVGGQQCMQALGFTLCSEDWILEPHAEAWDNLVLCKSKAERFMQRLSQSGLNPPSNAPVPAPASPIPAASSSTTTTAAPSAADVVALQQLMQFMTSNPTLSTASLSSSAASTSSPSNTAAVPEDASEPTSSDNNDT